VVFLLPFVLLVMWGGAGDAIEMHMPDGILPSSAAEAEMNDNSGVGVMMDMGGEHGNATGRFAAAADDGIRDEPAGAARNSNGNSNSNANFVVDNPNIDLEAYVQGYVGLARLSRLVFIADHCPMLRVEALRLGLQYVTATYNTGLYVTMHKKLMEAAAMGGNGVMHYKLIRI
jgi:hypothetical protein